jgi:hypothetical protein
MAARAHVTATSSVSPHTSRDGRSESGVTRRDLSCYLQRAMTRLGIQVKEIAFYWSTDHGYVSRVLSNKDPLPDHRLAQLPDELQCAVLEEWAKDLGVVTGRRADLARALESLARLADVDRLDVPIRMAKAALPEEPER